jgi:hypothetical protein
MLATYRPHGWFGYLGAEDKEQLDRIEERLQTLITLIQEVKLEAEREKRQHSPFLYLPPHFE